MGLISSNNLKNIGLGLWFAICLWFIPMYNDHMHFGMHSYAWECRTVRMTCRFACMDWLTKWLVLEGSKGLIWIIGKARICLSLIQCFLSFETYINDFISHIDLWPVSLQGDYQKDKKARAWIHAYMFYNCLVSSGYILANGYYSDIYVSWAMRETTNDTEQNICMR